ncbi:type II toxin-antitoxin system RelE/ParE family toxin [Geotalea uraniireducens]|uniref:Addiction module toxin, RelE/StbE family n=1 Tax=Geotalea uraniireducens (strain Rf4) TaxID=351605 RepID=A5G524_GEOUR|nr:type II toxin-antitoxin system mRNA interferase toxin, RelE/StbE family [Geotalea uraniireducens]ABQ26892.1 addiction module toxin, RelE/StbE family [Geotalea uraniireducens Rf4]
MHVKWTSKARRDLYSVDGYISQDNPTAAAETVLKIIAAVESLSQHAEMGRPGRVPDTRELVIPGLPFIVPYRISSSTIVILRVYHTSRKWPDQL